LLLRLKLSLLNSIPDTSVVQAGIASINHENGGAFYFMRANKRRIGNVLIPFSIFPFYLLPTSHFKRSRFVGPVKEGFEQ
jgi:hypothetical protein